MDRLQICDTRQRITCTYVFICISCASLDTEMFFCKLPLLQGGEPSKYRIPTNPRAMQQLSFQTGNAEQSGGSCIVPNEMMQQFLNMCSSQQSQFGEVKHGGFFAHPSHESPSSSTHGAFMPKDNYTAGRFNTLQSQPFMFSSQRTSPVERSRLEQFPKGTTEPQRVLTSLTSQSLVSPTLVGGLSSPLATAMHEAPILASQNTLRFPQVPAGISGAARTAARRTFQRRHRLEYMQQQRSPNGGKTIIPSDGARHIMALKTEVHRAIRDMGGRLLDVSLVNFGNHPESTIECIKHDIDRQFLFEPSLPLSYVFDYLADSLRTTRYKWRKH